MESDVTRRDSGRTLGFQGGRVADARVQHDRRFGRQIGDVGVGIGACRRGIGWRLHCGNAWDSKAQDQNAGDSGRVREAHDRSTRSEEHTSELQSLMRISYAVFCLKKKTAEHNTQQLTLQLNHEQHYTRRLNYTTT